MFYWFFRKQPFHNGRWFLHPVHFNTRAEARNAARIWRREIEERTERHARTKIFRAYITCIADGKIKQWSVDRRGGVIDE